MLSIHYFSGGINSVRSNSNWMSEIINQLTDQMRNFEPGQSKLHAKLDMLVEKVLFHVKIIKIWDFLISNYWNTSISLFFYLYHIFPPRFFPRFRSKTSVTTCPWTTKLSRLTLTYRLKLYNRSWTSVLPTMASLS